MKVELNYAKETMSCTVPDENYLGTLLPEAPAAGLRGEAEVLRALEHPVGSRRLRELVRPGQKIALVTSDITRPVPSSRILPLVMEELRAGGVQDEDVTVVLALGSHRPHSSEEKRRLTGEQIYDSPVCVVDSDASDCVRLGVCRNGTPVDIFRRVAEADFRICIGNVEFHYFAGYSGGCKALMPGVSSREAIQANHSNMTRPGAHAGNLDGNPVRQDIDQITEFISVDFIVNVVLDDHKEIVRAEAGHSIEAHREACAYLDRMYKIPLREKADIVLFSPGGYPKDINLYQAQKGLDNAGHAVKDGGILIWCASAREGFGEKTFEDWMLHKTPDEMIGEIRSHFKLGGHKAAAIAMVLKRAEIYFVSDLEKTLVEQMGMRHFDSLQQAVDEALRAQRVKGIRPKVLVMPLAGSTLPAAETDR
ncbi:nickel-dependent lactate racemase family protein [Bacilliculturomica massiliensis]|uniref:nickel-dependent lactate racemase n=1 Tax=Bacilliculturomica massiliensis TaxID=1917867 RepID=UPI00103136D6|nr:nickel-dependent lactate racemase [Bacilliculturomica massiliensis]